MQQLIILIFFLFTFSTVQSSDTEGLVCDCCNDKYGLGCALDDNHGWEYCDDGSQDHADQGPTELVQVDSGDEQCEGTACPCGCCPVKCWFCCCEWYCAPTAADCAFYGGLYKDGCAQNNPLIDS